MILHVRCVGTLVVLRTPTTTVGFLQVAYLMILQVRCCLSCQYYTLFRAFITYNFVSKFQEVDNFWNDIENEHIRKKINTEENELLIDEVNNYSYHC